MTGPRVTVMIMIVTLNCGSGPKWPNPRRAGPVVGPAAAAQLPSPSAADSEASPPPRPNRPRDCRHTLALSGPPGPDRTAGPARALRLSLRAVPRWPQSLSYRHSLWPVCHATEAVAPPRRRPGPAGGPGGAAAPGRRRARCVAAAAPGGPSDSGRRRDRTMAARVSRKARLQTGPGVAARSSAISLGPSAPSLWGRSESFYLKKQFDSFTIIPHERYMQYGGIMGRYLDFNQEKFFMKTLYDHSCCSFLQ